MNSQEFETYIPVYDVVPEKWEDARQFIVEQLKKISTGLNIRGVGRYLDQELLTGQQFIPTAAMSGSNSSDSQQFRSILRKVTNLGPLTAGVNPPIAHGITFDANFTLIDLWVAGTNSVTLTARVISGNDVVMTSTSYQITSPQAFDRAFAICEYTQEI